MFTEATSIDAQDLNILIIIVFAIDNRFLESKSVLSIHAFYLFSSCRVTEEEIVAEKHLRNDFRRSWAMNSVLVWEYIETRANKNW